MYTFISVITRHVMKRRQKFHLRIGIYLMTSHRLFKTKPTRCTLLLSIFISTSVHVSGNYVPIIRRTYCIYATLVGYFSLFMGACLVCRP